MAKLKIKICGLCRIQDIHVVNEVLPDYVGFVFANSKRQVNSDQAKALRRELDARIRAVGVFVNAPLSNIMTLCQNNSIDVVQLHGDEDAKYIAALRNAIPNPIIKAVRVQNTQQLIEARTLPCDYLLLDTYLKDSYGGSGISFDHSMIPAMEKPYFLAGGLNAENIVEASVRCCPYCLDVSSGVETHGVKDPNKMIEIVNIVRRLS